MKIIRANGTEEEFTFQTDNHLKEMQDIVGGLIERVVTPNGKTMVINEEGRLLGLDINKDASALHHGGVIVGDIILGDDADIFSEEEV